MGKVEILKIKSNESLDEFDCYVDFFRYTDTHNSAHDTLFRVDVD